MEHVRKVVAQTASDFGRNGNAHQIPNVITMPPAKGTLPTCLFLMVGLSTKPTNFASELATGTSTNDIKQADSEI
jgi:hypothetical protein